MDRDRSVKIPAITHLGVPVLRRRAKPVTRRDWPKLRQWVPQMMAAMRRAKGVGIAAPQVGLGKQLFIVAPEPSVRYPSARRVPPIVMINPKLLSHSKSSDRMMEGCLSIPGLRGEVPRWTSVIIEFTDLQGARRRAKLDGFIARIFQHEFDHIQGNLYVDRVQDTRTFMTESEYRRQMAAGRSR
jgi:peptide deformylase